VQDVIETGKLSPKTPSTGEGLQKNGETLKKKDKKSGLPFSFSKTAEKEAGASFSSTEEATSHSDSARRKISCR